MRVLLRWRLIGESYRGKIGVTIRTRNRTGQCIDPDKKFLRSLYSQKPVYLRAEYEYGILYFRKVW
jgi:hypothetical protein